MADVRGSLAILESIERLYAYCFQSNRTKSTTYYPTEYSYPSGHSRRSLDTRPRPCVITSVSNSALFSKSDNL